jgi:hypothetical protein
MLLRRGPSLVIASSAYLEARIEYLEQLHTLLLDWTLFSIKYKLKCKESFNKKRKYRQRQDLLFMKKEILKDVGHAKLR